MSNKSKIMAMLLSCSSALLAMDTVSNKSIIARCKSDLSRDTQQVIADSMLLDKQWWYCSQIFKNSDLVISVHLDKDRLATGCYDGNTRIFKRYADYTLEQLQLRYALHKWISIEKSNKCILSLKKSEIKKHIFADVIQTCELHYADAFTIWKTFPKDMRSSMIRTLLDRIEQYGKIG